MKKKVIISLAIVGVLALLVAVSVSVKGRQDAVEVQTGQAELTEELVAKVTATGEIKPKEFVELQSEITGIITNLYVEEGDAVQKGALLLRIDPRQLELRTMAERASHDITVFEAKNQQAQIKVQQKVVERDKAAVRKSEAELSRAQQNHQIGKRSFDRKQQMFEDNLISRDTYDASKNDLIGAETALINAELSLAQSKAQQAVAETQLEQEKIRYQNTLKRIEQSKANLDRTEDEFAKTVIRSPLSGVITQMNVEVGERAVPGTLNNPSATLMVIADLSVIEAEVEVDETDIVSVDIGQAAEVNVDALPDRPLKGLVTEIGASAIRTAGSSQEAKDFKVVIQLQNPPKSLRPGLSCTADITTAERGGVLTIPIQALTIREYELDDEGELIRKEKKSRRRPRGGVQADSSQAAASSSKKEMEEFQGVFVVDEEKKVQFVRVETGITGETDIEVLSGLKQGDTIVIGSYKALRSLEDGDLVKAGKKESD
ncbi:MAG: efflux RND transporter periplasmic adaptor subunit [Acidobacteriota bacterium]